MRSLIPDDQKQFNLFHLDDPTSGGRRLILLSSKKLENALARGGLTHWDKTKYLVLTVAFATLMSPALVLVRPTFDSEPSGIDMLAQFVGAVLSVVVVVVGIRRCFEINLEIDGERFIERFTVLFVPIAIRVAVVVIPVSIAANVVAFHKRERFPEVHQHIPAIMSMASPLIVCLYYWLLARSLRRLRTAMKHGRSAHPSEAP